MPGHKQSISVSYLGWYYFVTVLCAKHLTYQILRFCILTECPLKRDYDIYITIPQKLLQCIVTHVSYSNIIQYIKYHSCLYIINDTSTPRNMDFIFIKCSCMTSFINIILSTLLNTSITGCIIYTLILNH